MQEYFDQFPTNNASAKDAIEAIAERLPRWMKYSLFREAEFVAYFRERIMGIISQLPEDPESGKPLQIELAYIMNIVYEKYGIVIARDEYDRNIRTIEYELSRQNLLLPYRQFSLGETEDIDISEPRYMVEYLEYLHTYAFWSLDHLFTYVDTCVRLSQIPSGYPALQGHLDFIYGYIEDEEVDAMLIQNNYLGGSDMESSIELIQMEEKATSGDDMSDDEAQDLMIHDQRRSARFHIYLNHLVRNAISPRIHDSSEEKRKRLFDRLNDLRDIVDPKMFVPVSFKTSNTLEALERIGWEEEGRTVH